MREETTIVYDTLKYLHTDYFISLKNIKIYSSDNTYTKT